MGPVVFAKRYEVLELVGEGGMGRVYKVYDTVKTRHMALKELSREHIESSAALLRFRNEFRIMTEFRHPSMVTVSEFGISDEKIPYIVMEFVDGRNLSEFSPCSSAQAIEILLQLCRVLSVIHSRLYVHRDLKPDNIKRLKDGSIKLLDYGLMSQLGLPAPEKVSGTVYYLAPEALVGGILDERSDLYSLGIIAYELLTGHRPFNGTRKEILQGHLRRTPVQPSTLRPDIPAMLNRIVMTLLEKDRDRRYRNCAALLQDLLSLAGHATAMALPEYHAGYLYSSKLIGRTEEIERCSAHIQTLQHGQSHSTFIGAPAGIGKTRLLQEVKILAELHGLHSIWMSPQLNEHAPLAEIKSLVQYLASFSSDDTRQQYSLVLKWASGTAPPSELGEEHALRKVLVAWLQEITRQWPLVILLDDVQWMDPQGIQILNALIRQMSSFRAYFVCGFRSDELERTSPLWHTREENLSEYLELAPFSEEQIRRVIENLLSPASISDEFAAYCFKNCGGNTFDLIEFLRYLIHEKHLCRSGGTWLEPVQLEKLSLPDTLSARLLLRLKTLSPEARVLADSASVLGEPLYLGAWQSVSNYPEEIFFQAINELLSHQIISTGDGQYRFAHARIRDAVYDGLSSEQKRALHRKSGEFFESCPPETYSDIFSLLAGHFVVGEDALKAIYFSRKAAEADEMAGAEWRAFVHYRDAVRFLEPLADYPEREVRLLEMYEKAAQFSSAVWIDAPTCLQWFRKAIARYSEKQDIETVFKLSLSYIVTSSIAGDYREARRRVEDLLQDCRIEENTLSWAIMYGAAVCLLDWYQGCQRDCFRHAVAAIEIFERQQDELTPDVWPPYSWALFWREKARAYLGEPVIMTNVAKIRQLMLDGKSDQTIYWHTLTAVTARAAFCGRWDDLLLWKRRASDLSWKMGKIYWFECWISHSYLYAALHHGEFSQLKSHIEKVQASPDPYQQRLAYLFRGMLALYQQNLPKAEKKLQFFLEQEEIAGPDSSYLEGFVYLGQTYLLGGKLHDAQTCLTRGAEFANGGIYENPLYQLQFLRLQAELALLEGRFEFAEQSLSQSLKLAEQLDIPLQQGFIRSVWGRLLVAQHRKEDAAAQFLQARDIFLALENTYQASRLVPLLEACFPSLRPKVKMGGASADSLTGLSQTVSDEDGLTQTDLDRSYLDEQDSPASKKNDVTQVEKSDLEATEDGAISPY